MQRLLWSDDDLLILSWASRVSFLPDLLLPPLPSPQVTMMTLAEHIIEATPERIKQENFVPAEEASQAERTESAAIGTSMSWLASYLADVDRLPSAAQISHALLLSRIPFFKKVIVLLYYFLRDVPSGSNRKWPRPSFSVVTGNTSR
ncbi:Calmodulin-binding transcription activator 1, partial [Ophiophagus hannah]